MIPLEQAVQLELKSLEQPPLLSPPSKLRLTTATLGWLIVAVLFVVILLSALGYLINILLLFFLALTIGLGLMPLVDRLEGWGLPRILGGLLVYLLLLGGLAALLFFTIRPISSELVSLSDNLPSINQRIYDQLPDQLQEPLRPVLTTASTIFGTSPQVSGGVTNTAVISGSTVGSNAQVGSGQKVPNLDLSAVAQNLFGVVGGLAAGLIAFVSVLAISFYWMMLSDKPQRGFLTVVPLAYRERVNSTLIAIADRVGGYLRGVILLVLIIGSISYAGLFFLGVDFALVLAVIAGLGELLPNLGPVIAMVPAVLVGFAAGGGGMALKVLIFYVVIQQVESNFIAPQILGKQVKLPAILILASILIWSTLFGVLGAVLAVPLTAVIVTVVEKLIAPYLQQRASAVSQPYLERS